MGRVLILICTLAPCGCAASAELDVGEPACAAAALSRVDWGARATPPHEGWIELRSASFAGEGSALPAAISCNETASTRARLTPESYRFDAAEHTLDLILKHYGDAPLRLSPSAHVSYVLEEADGTTLARGELAFTRALTIEPGNTLHAGGRVGVATQVERVWACVHP